MGWIRMEEAREATERQRGESDKRLGEGERIGERRGEGLRGEAGRGEKRRGRKTRAREGEGRRGEVGREERRDREG